MPNNTLQETLQLEICLTPVLH